MSKRTLGLIILAALSCVANASLAQGPGDEVAVTSGVLKGVIAHHDGKPEWIALLVSEKATYLVVGGGERYAELKKQVGHRVLMRGAITTEFRDPTTGEVIPLEGKVAGVSYSGNLSIASLDAVSEQPVLKIEGLVEVIEVKSDPEGKKTTKVYRITLPGETPKRYDAVSSLARKLKPQVGHQVQITGYVQGDTLEAIKSIRRI
ncbi:MAG: hypothetical protein KDB53_13030 [Planctomycetes bacterium]|nr:hypothetical protein [Planctomycetota bacterium]